MDDQRLHKCVLARKFQSLRSLWQGSTHIVTLQAQKINTLGFVIITEDTKYNCKVPGIHLVLLAMRCDTVEV